MIFVLLCLFFFFSPNSDLHFYQCFSKCQGFILFSCCCPIVSHCGYGYVPRFLYPFIGWLTLGLVPFLGSCESHHHTDFVSFEYIPSGRIVGLYSNYCWIIQLDYTVLIFWGAPCLFSMVIVWFTPMVCKSFLFSTSSLALGTLSLFDSSCSYWGEMIPCFQSGKWPNWFGFYYRLYHLGSESLGEPFSQGFPNQKWT